MTQIDHKTDKLQIYIFINRLRCTLDKKHDYAQPSSRFCLTFILDVYKQGKRPLTVEHEITRQTVSQAIFSPHFQCPSSTMRAV